MTSVCVMLKYDRWMYTQICIHIVSSKLQDTSSRTEGIFCFHSIIKLLMYIKLFWAHSKTAWQQSHNYASTRSTIVVTLHRQPHELTQNFSTQLDRSVCTIQKSSSLCVMQVRAMLHKAVVVLVSSIPPGNCSLSATSMLTHSSFCSSVSLTLNFHSYIHHFYAKESQTKINGSSEKDGGLAVSRPGGYGCCQ